MRQMFLHLGLEFQTFVGIFGEIAGTGKDHIDLDTLLPPTNILEKLQ